MAEYLGVQGDGFTVLTGNAQLFRRALQMGARGGILAASLFAPEIALAVWRAVRAGDDASADAAARPLAMLGKVIVGELGPAGVKAALDTVGLRGGRVRHPLSPLSAADTDRVRELLRDAQVAIAA